VSASFFRRAVVVAGLLTASCSLFVSTDGLGDGSSDAGIIAATDGGDANVTADANAAPDAGIVDAAPFSCATVSPAPMFCDDFERDSVLGEWTDTDLVGGGTITIDAITSTSGTRSLLGTTPASATADTFNATIHHATFPVVVSDVHLDFDENIASAVDMNQFDLFRLTLHTPSDPASGALQIAITLKSTEIFLDENDYRVVPTKYIAHDYKRAPAYGKWERFSMHLTLGASPHVTVMLGADVIVDDDLTSPNVVPSSLELVLGLYNSYEPAAKRSVNFDDLVLDAK